LFFALWPAEEIRSSIERGTQAIVEHSGGRLVASDNLHVTLVFLGAVEATRIDAVKRAGGQVKASAFELKLDQIRGWRRAAVLCLAQDPVPPELRVLHQSLQYHLAVEQFPSESRAFRPHVTLSRRPARYPEAISISSIRWQVAEFVLVESRASLRGSQYTVIDRWSLETNRKQSES
jgi:2'-5' RNA ligase